VSEQNVHITDTKGDSSRVIELQDGRKFTKLEYKALVNKIGSKYNFVDNFIYFNDVFETDFRVRKILISRILGGDFRAQMLHVCSVLWNID
jgi:hypothetical protein